MDAQGILRNGRTGRMIVYPRYTLLERFLLAVVFTVSWPFQKIFSFLYGLRQKLEAWEEEDLLDI